MDQLVRPTHVKEGTKAEMSNHENLKWAAKHQEAFELLKSWLRSAPVLGYPDFSQPFKLETDAFCKDWFQCFPKEANMAGVG